MNEFELLGPLAFGEAAGRAVLDERGVPGVRKLVVANRGNLLYDKVVAGDYTPRVGNSFASLRSFQTEPFCTAMTAYFVPFRGYRPWWPARLHGQGTVCSSDETSPASANFTFADCSTWNARLRHRG